MLNAEVIETAMGRLSTLKYFPGGKSARAAVVMEIGSMCANDDQVEWLGKRAIQLYAEWPGLRELRAMLSSRWKPADGTEVGSEVYVDGIPSERGNDYPRLESPERPLLEAAAEAAPEIVPDCEKLMTRNIKFKRRKPSEIDLRPIRHLYDAAGFPK